MAAASGGRGSATSACSTVRSPPDPPWPLARGINKPIKSQTRALVRLGPSFGVVEAELGPGMRQSPRILLWSHVPPRRQREKVGEV